ncbi:hypothetical protein LTR08_003076 [Meristemomyces frigidus]|nr:hypothetical protein LTR08_003076 [Meristemomyces frigidus]
MVDFVEISGGNAENKTSGLHQSFGAKTMAKAPAKRSSRRCRFSCRGVSGVGNGMADAIDSGVCQLIGLGRSAVLEPELPREIILNREIADDDAVALSHIVRGQWFARLIPVKVVGSSLGIQFFYHNMRRQVFICQLHYLSNGLLAVVFGRLGRGLNSDPNMSIPKVIIVDTLETLRSGLFTTVGRLLQGLNLYRPPQKVD